MPNTELGQLERLSVGERLLIDRRRRGESQGEAAKRQYISHFTYGQAERDFKRANTLAPIIKRLQPHERCLLYRRRVGRTQDDVAKELGVCRWWLNQMERGKVSCDALLWFWEQ